MSGTLAAIAGKKGWLESVETTNGTHNPSASGVKLSGAPGNPSINVSVVPCFGPVKWYFWIRIPSVSATTTNSSWGLKASPLAKANLSIRTVLTLLARE